MMMTLGGIKLSQGCDNEFRFEVTDENGFPVTLSGNTCRFRISDKKLTKTYIDILGDNNPSLGICTVDDPEVGTITVKVKPIDKKDLPTNNEEGEEWILQPNNLYSVVLINDTTGLIEKIAQADCYTEAEL
jgi:hypothetical protein